MSDHLPAIVVIKNVEPVAHANMTIESRDLRPGNIKRLKMEISNINWSKELEVENVIPENVNHVFDKFQNKLLEPIDKFTSVKRRTVTEKKFRKEAWTTASILKCTKKF